MLSLTRLEFCTTDIARTDEDLELLSPMGVAVDETLSAEEKRACLVRMKQLVGPARADGSLDPGLADRRVQEIDNAMAHIDGGHTTDAG